MTDALSMVVFAPCIYESRYGLVVKRTMGLPLLPQQYQLN